MNTAMLERKDLWSLEQYAEKRAGFRAEVLAHKQNRRVLLGAHVLLVFEDSVTIKYYESVFFFNNDSYYNEV